MAKTRCAHGGIHTDVDEEIEYLWDVDGVPRNFVSKITGKGHDYVQRQIRELGYTQHNEARREVNARNRALAKRGIAPKRNYDKSDKAELIAQAFKSEEARQTALIHEISPQLNCTMHAKCRALSG